MRQGFTLIELIIVIAILVVLAGFMTNLFSANTQKAKIAIALSDMDTIKNAELRLRALTGQFSVTQAGAPLSDGTGLTDNKDDAGKTISGWRGPYINEYKKDPWGNSYSRIIVPGVNAFNVLSMGPDGTSGTADDINQVIISSNAI